MAPVCLVTQVTPRRVKNFHLEPSQGKALIGNTTRKKTPGRRFFVVLAEAVRFELTDPCESTVFKTVAIDHSATLPWGVIVAI